MSRKKTKKTMDKILVFIAIFLLIFVAVMIYIFITTGAVPDTLINAVFGLCGGEVGIMGWIKTTKDKFLDRDFEKEREKHKGTINKVIEAIGEEVL